MKNNYNILIIGASRRGYRLAKKLDNTNLKVGFISTHFENLPESAELNHVEMINGTVAFVEYFRRLLVVTLSTGEKFFCTQLVVATGKRAKKQLDLVNIPNVFYNRIELLQKVPKGDSCLVLGNSDRAISAAKRIKRHYKAVYICDPDAIIKPADLPETIGYLPRCTIISGTKTSNGYEALLSTYAKIPYQSILVVADRELDVDFLPDQFVKITDDFVEVNDKFQSTQLPILYIIGECLQDPTNDVQVVYEQLTKGVK